MGDIVNRLDAEFSEEEKAYFESGGKNESGLGDGSEEEIGRDGAADAPEEVDGAESEHGEELDGRSGEESGTEETDGPDDDSAEDDGDKSESRATESKRDFEKAYHAERLKKAELKAQMAEEARERQAIKQQLEALKQQMGERAERESIPNKEEDPLGYQEYQIAKVNKALQEQQNYIKNQSQQTEQERQYNNFRAKYAQSAREYMNERPDFAEAYSFMEQSRINEHMAAGYSAEEASSLLQQDELAIAARAFNEGVNPAERIYALAKARGYKAAPTTPPNTPTQSKLDNVKKGMNNSKSLGTNRAKSINDALDYSSIDKMSDEEFERYFEKQRAEQKDAGNYRRGY